MYVGIFSGERARFVSRPRSLDGLPSGFQLNPPRAVQEDFHLATNKTPYSRGIARRSRDDGNELSLADRSPSLRETSFGHSAA